MQILPITVVENFALPDDAGAAQVDLCDMARDLRALIGGIVDVCRLIGRGAFISVIMVLFFLPMCLMIFDRFIIKPDHAERKHA